MNILQSIFYKLEPILISFYRKLLQLPPPNLEGDRHIEYSWIAAHIPDGPGYALDFGCGTSSYLGLIVAQRGFKITAVDLEKINWPYFHPNLKFIQDDFLKLDFPPKSFDLIINCSSVEHVGLVGRYGVTEDVSDGDLLAMKKLSDLLKKDGLMFLTIPIGKDIVVKPYHRVYGKERLPKLLQGFVIIKEEYWTKNNQNKWIKTTKEYALNYESPHKHFYNLGCFILQPKI